MGLTAWILIRVIFHSCWFSLMLMKDLVAFPPPVSSKCPEFVVLGDSIILTAGSFVSELCAVDLSWHAKALVKRIKCTACSTKRPSGALISSVGLTVGLGLCLCALKNILHLNLFFVFLFFLSLSFLWPPLFPPFTLYFRSPALIGCFVVDRRYFEEIGLLDEGMEIYGGENVELGIRVSRLHKPAHPEPHSHGNRVPTIPSCSPVHSPAYTKNI